MAAARPLSRTYLDYNATAPLRPEAREAALAAMETTGNPSSVHAEGRAARRIVEEARSDVARLVGVAPRCVTFVSGGAEAANAALNPHFGAGPGAVPLERLIVSAGEHACVLSGHRFPAAEIAPLRPDGRLEGRFHPAKQRGAPIAVVLHSHPQFGGTMNNQIVYNTYYNFAERGFSVLRFNFRGVGRSQGAFDHGQGELSDAASALDWAQSISPEARACWIAGVSFGSWIGMQLLMRRPEIEGFISIAPPANRFDFSFLAPCPSSGLFVHGDKDRVAPLKEVLALIEKLKTQKGILIEHAVIPEANHFFEDCIDELHMVVGAYLDKRLGMPRHAPPAVRKERAKPTLPQRDNR
jgi:alpha/beta superfamily hydrolase